jgi:predicted signal transduction protein with EAL and GGDEF domain
MAYDAFMNQLFYICVALLRWGAYHLGMTYEELNIWIFVVIHPLITVVAIGLAIYYWVRLRNVQSAHNLHVQQLQNVKKPQDS